MVHACVGARVSSDRDLGPKILAALALMGLTYIAFQNLGEQEQRRHFKDALRRGLAAQGIGYVDAELARLEGGQRAWRVTVNHPWEGIWQDQVVVPAGQGYTSPHALNAILEHFGAAAA